MKIKHLCFFSKHEKLAIFYTGTNLNLWHWIGSAWEGQCVLQLFVERRGSPKEPKKDLLLGPNELRCLPGERSVSLGCSCQGHRRQLVLKVNSIRCVAVKRLFCNQHNSDAINRRWQWQGTEHRRTSWL